MRFEGASLSTVRNSLMKVPQTQEETEIYFRKKQYMILGLCFMVLAFSQVDFRFSYEQLRFQMEENKIMKYKDLMSESEWNISGM